MILITELLLLILISELVNYEFDRIDLLCLGVSSAFGIWYLWKKVNSCFFSASHIE